MKGTGYMKGRCNNFPGVISTYGDHRMAMAFAPLLMVFPEMKIENAEPVVRKSFPGFWKEFKKISGN